MSRIQQLPHLLKLVGKDILGQIREAQLPLAAGSLAYVTILSIVPLLAVSFSIFQAFGGLDRIYSTIEPFILSHLAESASEEATSTIRRFIRNTHATALGVGGMIGLIFTSVTMLSSAESAINRVWKSKIERSWFQRIAYYWIFITLGPLALAMALGVATSKSTPISHVLPSGVGVFGITVAIFFAIYKWVPCRKVNWPPALIAAVFTSVIWRLARWSYGIYTSQVLTYRNIYGGLAAIPIFLLWVYIIWIVVLSGAAVTAALQKRFDFD